MLGCLPLKVHPWGHPPFELLKDTMHFLTWRRSGFQFKVSTLQFRHNKASLMTTLAALPTHCTQSHTHTRRFRSHTAYKSQCVRLTPILPCAGIILSEMDSFSASDHTETIIVYSDLIIATLILHFAWSDKCNHYC